MKQTQVPATTIQSVARLKLRLALPGLQFRPVKGRFDSNKLPLRFVTLDKPRRCSDRLCRRSPDLRQASLLLAGPLTVFVVARRTVQGLRHRSVTSTGLAVVDLGCGLQAFIGDKRIEAQKPMEPQTRGEARDLSKRGAHY
ncbi:hypothetical protein Acr_08g0012150 [Actinidia rufa]|uniref:Uncharacterized protein n=1 Tax=Actinidia rufa TaxID=165716 RepID=A0A7J0F3K6_9ERIC|nr:hypothetical protein Acr_08g0012150 [Actinidia rufa]